MDNKSLGALRTFYHKHLVLSHLILVAIVSVFLCFFVFFFLDIWTNHGRTTEVPEVRMVSYAEATKILGDSNLKCEIADSVYDSETAPGTVKEMWPHPGTRVKPGRTIFLTINSFEPQRVTVTMPLTGVSSRQAMTYLESLNIKNVRMVYVPSNFPDLVEGAKYKGKSITPGMQIPVNGLVVLEVGTVVPTADMSYDEPEIDVDIDMSGRLIDDTDDDTETSAITEPDEAPEPTANPDVFD